MTDLTRRDFGRLALGAGLMAALRVGHGFDVPFALPGVKSTVNGVRLGCNTYSFGTMSLEASIQGMLSFGCGMTELHPAQLGLRGGGGGRRGAAAAPAAGGVAPTPPTLAPPPVAPPMPTIDAFVAMGKKVKDAGLYLFAYNANIGGVPTDADLEHHCEITKALGCRMITAVGSLAMFRQLDPIAKKHDLYVALHNEANIIRNVADFEAAREGLSDHTGFTLDIGHFVAAGGDPIAMLEKHHDRISNLHVKDRKANGGPTVAMGTGDTPVKEVLRMVRDRKWNIPCHVEHELAADDRVASAKTAFEYCLDVLKS